MNKIVLVAVGAVALAVAGVSGAAYLDSADSVQAESLCVATQSDAAEAARAQNLALVDVVERGRLVPKGSDAGLQTFKVRTVAVFKGALPAEAEIGLPQGSQAKLAPGSRYEVSVLGPDDGTWLARFTRQVASEQTADALAAHWRGEIAKQFVEPPCSDIVSS
ncbi:hypothetical protein [Streptomyces sp. NPDC056549]|uniref:hypothetical protein n=1 Tax=Streptomyces sp. NPDC056549 TaxID=3345864 RepID=UPI003697C7A7